MLTYHEVMTTDFGRLTTAADKWEAMAGEIKKVEARYKDTVRNIRVESTWSGSSASSARINFAGTRYEYAAAQTQAKAIAALLRDAHTQFVDLKKRLDSARADAVKGDLHIDSRGTVSHDESKLTGQDRMYLRDHPEAVAALNKRIKAMAHRIKTLVQAFDDADQGVKIALAAVAVDSNKDAFGKGADDQLNGFNAGALSDIEQYEVINTTETALKINGGEKVSAAEYAEFNRSMRDNAQDKAFSQTFLNSIGAEGTIKLGNKLNDLAYYTDKKSMQTYLGIERGLSTAIASATRVPEFKKDGKVLAMGSREYAQELADWKNQRGEWAKNPDSDFYNAWLDDVKSNGTKEFDSQVTNVNRMTTADQKALGYQTLVTVMQNGGDYSGPFLHDLADSIRAAENPAQGGNKDIWDLDHKFDVRGGSKTSGWFANDPLDGLLGVMSKNPDAATAYFDPQAYSDVDHKFGKDRLEYLQSGRDWDVVNEYGTRHKDGALFPKGDTEDVDNRVGFGAALEAAMTGNVPGSPVPEGFTKHSEAQVRVLEDVVKSYAEIAKIDQGAMPANIRVNMANALAYYPGDVHDVISGQVDYTDPRFSTHPNDIDVNRQSMNQFIRALSEDGDAFRKVHYSQVGHIAEQIGTLDKDDFMQNPTGDTDRGTGIAKDAGKIMGTLDEIRADVLGDARDSKISENNWDKVYGYHAYGAPVTGIPVIGDSLQRMIDIGTGMRAENLNDAVTDATKEKLISYYAQNGYPRLELMLVEHAAEVGVPDDYIKNTHNRMGRISESAGNAYERGLGSAQGSTGENG
ncbi:DUF6571 family protein [Streptomyces sp. NPDC091289]|uniref:DUF6571 family protein n=1 Tax=Streptomyces sp. NPDC091289 TaxID=3365989 RepID=UPI0037F360C6